MQALGRGLRALHDALPVVGCPFSWSVPERIANAAVRGIRVPDDLRVSPPIDRLVVCHGDACAPNTLIDDDGAWTGHVDLGALGLGDRWADIAVAAMSTEWNYGPGWHDALLDAYGVAPDATRLAFYRQLWNATLGAVARNAQVTSASRAEAFPKRRESPYCAHGRPLRGHRPP